MNTDKILLFVDLALIAPIVFLFLEERRPPIELGMIPTIAMAAYATWQIVMACVQYRRSRKGDNLILHGLKILNLKEAIVSIITLQNTMIAVFGDAGELRTLTLWTNLGMFVSLLAITLYQLIVLRKKKISAKNRPD